MKISKELVQKIQIAQKTIEKDDTVENLQAIQILIKRGRYLVNGFDTPQPPPKDAAYRAISATVPLPKSSNQAFIELDVPLKGHESVQTDDVMSWQTNILFKIISKGKVDYSESDEVSALKIGVYDGRSDIHLIYPEDEEMKPKVDMLTNLVNMLEKAKDIKFEFRSIPGKK
jgi:hypothetical protein